MHQKPLEGFKVWHNPSFKKMTLVTVERMYVGGEEEEEEGGRRRAAGGDFKRLW